MYKYVVAAGNVWLINNEKPTSFAGGSASGQMTFWVGHARGHVTLFARDRTHCDWSVPPRNGSPCDCEHITTVRFAVGPSASHRGWALVSKVLHSFFQISQYLFTSVQSSCDGFFANCAIITGYRVTWHVLHPTVYRCKSHLIFCLFLDR